MEQQQFSSELNGHFMMAQPMVPASQVCAPARLNVECFYSTSGFDFATRGEPLLTLPQLPNARPQRGVEMTWDMKAHTWIERQVTFFCADEPFAEGAMRRAYYIKFEKSDRLRGGDRMCVCCWCSACDSCCTELQPALFHRLHNAPFC